MNTLIKRIILILFLSPAFIVSAQEMNNQDDRNCSLHLRTNLLSDIALASPNLAAELLTRGGLSVIYDYTIAFLPYDADFDYNAFHIMTGELRYYFTNDTALLPKGHHLGVYGQLATFDFMYKTKGYQCKPFTDTYAFGLCYGYSYPVNKRLRFDFSFGIGYLHSTYSTYKEYRDLYIKTDTKTFTGVLPTRAEVSLVWKIN